MQRLQDNIFIFDLDGTTIDSRHRQGETLEDWFRLNTPENVARDKPLLLAKAIRDLWESGFHVLICTSRTLSARKSNSAIYRISSTLNMLTNS